MTSGRVLLNGSRRRRFGRSRPGQWWGIIGVDPADPADRVGLELRAGDREAHLGELKLRTALEPPQAESRLASDRAAELGGTAPLVAICLATHEPPAELLRRQLDSIRAQSHGSWLCLISDDGSTDATRAEIEALIGGDRRFLLMPTERRLGIYANFERTLTLVPPQAEFVALADQDDLWLPDKLEALIDALGDGAPLAYSDMRVVDPAGELISPTYWRYRPNNYRDFGSLLLANTVTGAATMLRRSLLDSALPFPPSHGVSLHDHWLAQVAIATGTIAYVERPLMDYVQHPGAALGHLGANADGRFGVPARERARAWARLLADPRRSLDWRRPYFDLYCRLVQTSAVLGMRCADTLAPDRAELLERLAERRFATRWLIDRTLRRRPEHASTLGREAVMLAGLAWAASIRA